MAWVTFIKEMRMWTVNTTTNKNFCTTVFQNCISSPYFAWWLVLNSQSTLQTNLYLGVEYIPWLHWFLHHFALWYDQRISHPALNQSDAKLKLYTTWSPAFSRALGSLVVITLTSHCLLKGIFFSFDWPLRLLWFWFYHNQSNTQKPIGCETKTIHNLVIHVFPRSIHFCSFSWWALIGSLWHFSLF